MLFSQNFQHSGVITLSAGAAVAVQLLVPTERSTAAREDRAMLQGAYLLLFAVLLPSSIHNAAVLGLHAHLAGTDRGQALPLPNFDRIRLARPDGADEPPDFVHISPPLRTGRGL